jgi:hypothetical protein
MGQALGGTARTTKKRRSASRGAGATATAVKSRERSPKARVGTRAPKMRRGPKPQTTSRKPAAPNGRTASRVKAAAARTIPESTVTVPAELLSTTWLTEEEQIESSKYVPREGARVFEEERFIFPESYGRNRIRLMVKDPEWLFAYWDVETLEFETLRSSIGERAAALSRLTLKVSDAFYGGSSIILLPYGARSWYVRADSSPRSYRAELGITLPSGEFRRLAESNTVTTPRVGPSPEAASRVLVFSLKRRADGEAPAPSPAPRPVRVSAGPGPWKAPPPQGTTLGQEASPSSGPSSGMTSSDMGRAGQGGASETYRR